MFIGHYGVALALKKAEPKLSLGWLFIGAMLVDIVFSMLVFFGVEEVKFQPGITEANALDLTYYPYSHSLLMAWIWALIVYAVARWTPLFKELDRARVALVMSIAVVSHWFFDLIVHRPDLPLLFGDSTKVGLGLWYNLPLSLIAEILIFAGGLWIYLTATQPASMKKGKVGIYIFAAILLVLFIATTFSGSMPPSAKIMGAMNITSLFVLAWIAWAVDKRRIATPLSPPK
jgi:hypothetical protein